MCGIAGFYCSDGRYQAQPEHCRKLLDQMTQVLRHRGPDAQTIHLDECCGLAHVRLSILDLKNGDQPMHTIYKGKRYTIVYNGEIYNMPALRNELIMSGMDLRTSCDTEIILKGYAKYGAEYIHRLNGIFAFAIWEADTNKLFLCRDRFGVKPLYYTKCENEIIFASEAKGLFCHPKVSPRTDRNSLCELIALGPAHTAGKCAFQDITEVLPGHHVTFSQQGIADDCYWELKGLYHRDSKEQTLEKTRFLVEDAIKMQMLSDIPICTFLSGGLDSSLVSSVCARELKKQGLRLSTYSFDYPENDAYFQANGFQPSQDAPFAEEMTTYLNTDHTRLLCSNDTLAEYLTQAVDARDYPCMADVESSLLYFCGEVAKHHKVTLTGECADEIFGGYPWFYRKDMFERDDFPWSYDISARTALLKDEVITALPLAEYAHQAYADTIGKTPRLTGESPKEARRRELSYLNLRWFMATLLERMDRTSMHSGLEARVPFSDHRIVEYVYNVPWHLKRLDGMEKGLLRGAMKGYLPDSVLYRKKSPYPKTYHPHYEKLLKHSITAILNDPDQPVHELIDRQKTEAFLALPAEYGKPWYGQLMAGPQMLAYVVQINYWMKKYQIRQLF